MVLTGDRAGCLHRFRLSRLPPDAVQAVLAPDADHARWSAHVGRVWSLCPAHEGDAWFTTGADGRVRAWEAASLPGAQRTWVAPTREPLCDLAYTPDGELLLVLDEVGGVTVYDARGLRALRRLTAPHADWRSLCLLPGRDEVAAGGAHGLVAIWNYRREGPPRLIIDLGAPTAISGLAFDPATQQLVVLPRDLEEVCWYHVEDGTLAGRISTGNHWAMALAPRGQHLTVDLPNRLVTFELPTGRPLRQRTGHAGSVYSLAYSPDGTLLAASGADRRLYLGPAEAARLPVLTGRLAEGQQVVFSPDGHRLVSADAQGGLHVVDVATRQTLLSLALPCQRLLRIALSGDGQHLAAIVERGSQRVLIVLGPANTPTTLH